MGERREVRIFIGKRNYRMQTDLDDVTLERVTTIVAELASAIDEGLEQDNLLMLVCLQLAYNLEKISTTLGPLQEKLEKLLPWESPALGNEK